MKGDRLQPVSVRLGPVIWAGDIRKRNIAAGAGNHLPALYVTVGADTTSPGASVAGDMPTEGAYTAPVTLLTARWREPLPTMERCLQEAIRALVRVAHDQGWDTGL